MAIQKREAEPYWNYFLALEEDLVELARYVEFSERNFQAFSTEMARLLLAASSEVDVVMKLRCQQLGEAAANMRDYRGVLRDQEPVLAGMRAFIPRYGLVLTPWENWRRDESPDWWLDYNSVKHQRNTEFTKANLKNVLNAMAGLSLLLLAYYAHDENRLRVVPAPSLFTPPQELASKQHAMDGETGLFFNREEAGQAGS